jgi:hypothetical protein
VTNDVPSVLSGVGHELIVHTVVTGGQALPDTLNSVRPVWTEIDVGILVLRVLMQACDYQTLIRFNRPTMAWANSLVDAVPPRSPVRTLSSFSV